MAQANIRAVITAEDKASSVLKGFGDRVEGFGSTLAGVAKKASIAFGAAAVAATGFAVKSAADFEQTRIGLENMLGSADKARDLLSKISKFAAQTPFEFPELAQATRQLVAFGFSAEDAFDTMQQLGDVSAAVGAPINDLAYLMGTLRTQGRAFTIDIRQFAQRGIPIYEYLAKVLGKSEAEISKMIEAGKIGFPEVQKAFEAMTGEGGKFHDTMAKQSKSLSGLFSTLKDNIGLAARELVGITEQGDIKPGSLFDFLRKGLTKITEDLPKAIQGIKDFFAEVKPDLLNAFVQAMEYLSPKFTALGDALRENVVPHLKDLWENVIKPLVPALGVGLVGAIGFLTDAIIWLTDVFDELVKVYQEKIQPSLMALWNSVVTELLPAFKELWPEIKEVGKVLGGIVFTTFITGVWITINAINLLIKAFAWLVDAYNWAREEASKNWQKIGAIVGGVLSGIGGAIMWVIGLTKSLFDWLDRVGDKLPKGGKLPGYATGTSYAPGGMAMVGERGPELVNLPRGAQVIPADKTARMMGGGGASVNVSINVGVHTGSDMEMRKLANTVLDALHQVAASEGTTLQGMITS